jgi:hypothetical protein
MANSKVLLRLLLLNLRTQCHPPRRQTARQGSRQVIDGNMVSARAWPDNPAWVRAFISLLKQKAPVHTRGMAAR